MRRNKCFAVLSVLLTIALILLAAFVFPKSYLRLNEGFIDLFSSIKFYFLELVGIEHNTLPTVELYSKVINTEVLPQDYPTFQANTTIYFKLLLSSENFALYTLELTNVLTNVLKAIAIILPCVIFLFYLTKKVYTKPNNKYNEDTLPLRIYKWIITNIIHPLKNILKEFFNYVKEREYIYVTWIFLVLLNLNIVTILIEFIAFYIYFAITLKFNALYVQFNKLVIDLAPLFTIFSPWILLPILLLILNNVRKKIAQNRLRRFEAKNCGFISSLPIVTITCGSMGKKKTTMVTDMALSQEVMFRQRALKTIQKIDLIFSRFPWICFEKELEKCIEYNVIYNLATVKEWVRLKRRRYEKHHNKDLQLYGYNVEEYKVNFNDRLKNSNIFDLLETYAMAYFIYILETSLIVSNYSIRTDNEKVSVGNFPLWQYDFFPKDLTKGKHSHILDFDVLRLGKKVVENNEKSGSFEFGVVVITEVGKERGNNLELKEIKKGTSETNQKNDLFNSWLKMCRHSSTVDNYPYIKVFTDEQRPESWGADARDLSDIIHIAKSCRERLALPFFTLEEMIYEWFSNFFIRIYYDFRFVRGDNTLLIHILKGITSVICKHNLRTYNTYGYSVLKVEKERGTQDGKRDSHNYYLMNKKIYSSRFSTDCFSDYFNDLARKSSVGLKDYVEYATKKASVSELKSQNSYFINSIYKEE